MKSEDCTADKSARVYTSVIEIHFPKLYLFCSQARVPETAMSDTRHLALGNLLGFFNAQ